MNESKLTEKPKVDQSKIWVNFMASVTISSTYLVLLKRTWMKTNLRCFLKRVYIFVPTHTHTHWAQLIFQISNIPSSHSGLSRPFSARAELMNYPSHIKLCLLLFGPDLSRVLDPGQLPIPPSATPSVSFLCLSSAFLFGLKDIWLMTPRPRGLSEDRQ